VSLRDRAPDWNAMAARLLGWRPAEFWEATPSELATALRDPTADASIAPPDCDLITKMMERDAHGR